MKWIAIPLVLMAATSAFPGTNTGKIIEVTRSQSGCTDYMTITILHSNGTTTSKYRLNKVQDNFKDVLAISLSGLTSGMNATIDYADDSPSCGTTYYLQGITLKAQ